MASKPLHSQLQDKVNLNGSKYNSSHNQNTTCTVNSHEYDHSMLACIDPDVNYLNGTNIMPQTQYYVEKDFNTEFSQNNNLSLFHINIRSIPKHFNELSHYLDTLAIKFKIIGVTETWLKGYHINYRIPNYNSELDMRAKKPGGGVSLYLHSSLQYTVRTDLQMGADTNSVFVEINCNSTLNKRNIVVGCIYRPPYFSLSKFNDLLNNMLGQLQGEHKYIYLIGDFNCNTMANINAGHPTEEFKNIFSANFLFPLINQPTRITQFTATCIDNMYCNIPNLRSHCNAGILVTDISDHLGIFCVSNSITIENEKQVIKKRLFSTKNVNNFKKSLKNETWDFIPQYDVQNAFTRFQGVIDLHFKHTFPEQTITMTYKNRYDWVQKALSTRIRLKNTMYLSTLSNKNDTKLISDYKILKNKVTSDLRNAEIEHFSNQLEINKNDCAKSWKVLKNIIGKDSKQSKQKTSFLINGKVVYDSQVIANEFNIFFVSIGPLLAKDIVSTVNPLFYLTPVVNSIVMLEMSIMEVRYIIESLKDSSPGWDNIPTLVAKQCVDSYIEPLTDLINKSISEGVFPSELKLARVVPIFKSGDSSSINNYRPISILSFFSKVFEKIMYNSISDFMESSDTIYKYQFGFRKKHSTQLAIMSLVDKITSSLDTGDVVIGIFLDLKKAFDTVSHKILLRKLHAYGIRGNILKWFASYLSNRSQYVVYDGRCSQTDSIECGVPQGSILGPLLFIVYMNDICNVSEFLYTILYADDTCVVANGQDYKRLIAELNNALDNLSIWLKANKLSLNAQKTFYMVFHRARIKDHNVHLYMDNEALSGTKVFKYLGLLIDDKLKWTHHVLHVRNKIAKGIGIMYKARKYVHKKDLISLYYSFIYPYMIYCVEIWGHAAACHIDPLFFLQKKIIRIMTFSPYLAHTSPLFDRLSIFPFNIYI
ncbi:MAG: reverse transcriptase domain-containing protein [Reichenbachiella sp.]